MSSLMRIVLMLALALLGAPAICLGAAILGGFVTAEDPTTAGWVLVAFGTACWVAGNVLEARGSW